MVEHLAKVAAIHPSAADPASIRILGFAFGRIAHPTAAVPVARELDDRAVLFSHSVPPIKRNPARVFGLRARPAPQSRFSHSKAGYGRLLCTRTGCAMGQRLIVMESGDRRTGCEAPALPIQADLAPCPPPALDGVVPTSAQRLIVGSGLPAIAFALSWFLARRSLGSARSYAQASRLSGS
jgi:hypothetical protein